MLLRIQVFSTGAHLSLASAWAPTHGTECAHIITGTQGSSGNCTVLHSINWEHLNSSSEHIIEFDIYIFSLYANILIKSKPATDFHLSRNHVTRFQGYMHKGIVCLFGDWYFAGSVSCFTNALRPWTILRVILTSGWTITWRQSGQGTYIHDTKEQDICCLPNYKNLY